jgi:transposase
VLKEDSFSGHLFAFRGRNARIIKIPFWDGSGLCLFTKRMEYGGFMWPSVHQVGETIMLSAAQLAMLIEGIDWRRPEQQWKPRKAGRILLGNLRKAWENDVLMLSESMRLDLENLPSDTALLHQLVRDMAAVVDHRGDEIERLQAIIKKLQRMQFGRRSERLDPDQLALGREDLDADIGGIEENRPVIGGTTVQARAHRKPSPDHLPREDVTIDTAHDACPCCGSALHGIGESVSEMLNGIPAQLRVVRITRPKYACRTCGTVHQAPAPERPIAGGLGTPALLAQVLTAKYCDHTPLYRQSQIFARHGVDLSRSTLAGWVGEACWWLEALHGKLCADVFSSSHLFADDTPVPVLDPGRGKTKTGRLWVYAREQRGWNGPAPPAAVYPFAPDRKAERPVAHLQHFKGVLHVDGYAG